MLILARRLDESLVLGDGIEIKVVSVQGSGEQATVRLGIVAPPSVRIWRKEIYEQVVAANRAALAAPVPPVTVGTGAADSGLAALIVQPAAAPAPPDDEQDGATELADGS